MQKKNREEKRMWLKLNEQTLDQREKKWQRRGGGGEEGTMTNPNEYETQQDSNTYFITQPDSSDKSLNMQIALYLFQWQIMQSHKHTRGIRYTQMLTHKRTFPYKHRRWYTHTVACRRHGDHLSCFSSPVVFNSCCINRMDAPYPTCMCLWATEPYFIKPLKALCIVLLNRNISLSM